MATIRAVVVDPGATGKLALSTVEAPVARPNEAQVRVHAISLNRGEVNRAQSSPAGALPGWDIAGVVEQPAADGTGPKAGQRVVGILQTGAWAEQIAVPATNLAVLPESVSFQVASTLPVAGLTALYALDRASGLTGRRVLITGASGGVGNFAIQIAKHGGATVTALVRQERHAQSAKDAGADHVVVDETGEGVRAHGPYAVILDSVSGPVLVNALSNLNPYGLLVTYGSSLGGQVTLDSALISRLRGGAISGLGVFTELHRQTAGVGLSRLIALVDRGALKPLISVEAPWSEVGSVARQLLDRSYPGKAVLTVS